MLADELRTSSRKGTNFLTFRRYLSMQGLVGLRMLRGCHAMRSQSRQRVPVWRQMIIMVFCATAMVVAGDGLATVWRGGTIWTTTLFLS